MRNQESSTNRRQPPRFASWLYPVPTELDALITESAWRRLTHSDLHGLTRAELRRELSRCTLRITLEDEPSELDETWLLERRQRLLEALGRVHAA